MPFYDDLVARYNEHGTDGLVSMPQQWWTELGPIGTMDDAHEHIAALEAAGVTSIGMFPSRNLETAKGQIDDVLRLAAP